MNKTKLKHEKKVEERRDLLARLEECKRDFGNAKSQAAKLTVIMDAEYYLSCDASKNTGGDSSFRHYQRYFQSKEKGVYL